MFRWRLSETQLPIIVLNLTHLEEYSWKTPVWLKPNAAEASRRLNQEFCIHAVQCRNIIKLLVKKFETTSSVNSLWLHAMGCLLFHTIPPTFQRLTFAVDPSKSGVLTLLQYLKFSYLHAIDIKTGFVRKKNGKLPVEKLVSMSIWLMARSQNSIRKSGSSSLRCCCIWISYERMSAIYFLSRCEWYWLGKTLIRTENHRVFFFGLLAKAAITFVDMFSTVGVRGQPLLLLSSFPVALNLLIRWETLSCRSCLTCVKLPEPAWRITSMRPSLG